MAEKVDVVFTTLVPPGVSAFHKQLYEAGFLKRGGRLSCVYYDENALNISPFHEIEGLASCLDYFQAIDEPFSNQLLAKYNKMFPGNILFSGTGSGTYRGIKLWEAAVKEAGSVDRDAVDAALDHARIENGPGGPAEMVPGTHHAKMNMYIGVATGGKYVIVEKLGMVHPKECMG
jgi:branched-chain amino acid transport system substrate-binding protein